MARQWKELGWVWCLALALLVSGLPRHALAQPADPRFAQAQQAYQQLSEGERRAIQRDLGFVAGFAGAAAGGFGPLTFQAISRFQRMSGAAETGQLSGDQRVRLAAVAEDKRREWQFNVVSDPRAGVQIGVPKRLLPREEANAAGGSRWQSADQRVTLDTTSLPGGKAELVQSFERATSPTVQGRRITYRLQTEDFFVVTGETATGKFYRRLAVTPAGLKGFSLGYDRSLANLWDPLSAVIANHFEASAASGTVAVAAASPASATQAVPAAAAPAALSGRSGNALVVAGQRAITTAAVVEGCRTVSAGGKTATIAGRSGTLVLLTFPGGPAEGGSLSLSKGSADLVAVAFGEAGGALQVIPATRDAAGSIHAALQPGAAGAAVMDRSGHLVGLVATDPTTRARVAGVVPSGSWPVLALPDHRPQLEAWGGTVVEAAFSGDAQLSLRALADKAGKMLLAVTCGV